MIPITAVRFGEREEQLVLQVLRSGQLAQGPMVERFEAACRAMTNAEHAVAVNNGTTALVIALEALQLQPGDEVITTPFTFVATLNAILEAGATARFADIADDYTIDPASIEALVSPRTKVIMPVHLYGRAADMDAISPIAATVGAVIVEDAAQSHGATVADRPVGTYGLAGFSFYATKNIACGEGGVVTTNNAVLADRMRVLRNQGMRARYQYEMAGHNSRLTDLAAAVALPQFDDIGATIAARRHHAARLTEGLSGVSGLDGPVPTPGRESVWHQYTVRVNDESCLTRDEVAAAVAARGIGCGIYYPKAVYDYDCYRTHPRVMIDSSPRAEQAASSVLSLPVHQHLSEADLDTIIATVRSVMGHELE